MKKIFLITLLAFFMLIIAGCDIYADTSKKDMDLTEIKVYDKDNNEITGTYKNYYSDIYQDTSFKEKGTLIPLNSAAPVENYYSVNAKASESYTVKFTFYSKKGYTLSKIIFSNKHDDSYNNLIECTNIEKIDNNQYVATLVVTSVTTDNQLYKSVYWYKGEEKNNFHTKGSNTYIKGVYFDLQQVDNTSC